MLRPNYFVVIHEGIAKDPIEEIPRSELPPIMQKESGNLHNMEVAATGATGIHPS